jgi:hypothetical protein
LSFLWKCLIEQKLKNNHQIVSTSKYPV